MFLPTLSTLTSPTGLLSLLLLTLLLMIKYRAHTKVVSLIQYWIEDPGEQEGAGSHDQPFSVVFRDQADSDWESGVEFDIR